MPKQNRQKRGITESNLYYKEFMALAGRIKKRIYQARIKKGLTQESMTEFGLNWRQYQRIECGVTKNITLANLFKISKALGVKLSDLVE